MKNTIHPKKLLNSKWTAVTPELKEKHFTVTTVDFDDDGNVLLCELTAVLSKNVYSIDWCVLKNTSNWQQGWK